MKENIIKNKTIEFALRIINLSKFLQKKKEFVISRQVLRSGTSVGALVRESEHAESKLDFVHKIAIAQKEANETVYWLELLYRSDFIDEKMYESLEFDIVEIQKILSSIIITSKKNIKSKKSIRPLAKPYPIKK
ncbi:MAG TPA: four helix bundle protein [Bacteroidia bacterium]|nr:four helix bundle protein [Bacteroidia bacterium]